MLAHRRWTHRLKRLANKSPDQHLPRLLLSDAAGFHVEECRFIEIANRSPMAALYVVGIDLELWLGIDRGARAEHQVLTELVRVNLLSVRPNNNAALEGAVRPPRGDPFEDFAGLTAGRGVVDGGNDIPL